MGLYQLRKIFDPDKNKLNRKIKDKRVNNYDDIRDTESNISMSDQKQKSIVKGQDRTGASGINECEKTKSCNPGNRPVSFFSAPGAVTNFNIVHKHYMGDH